MSWWIGGHIHDFLYVLSKNCSPHDQYDDVLRRENLSLLVNRLSGKSLGLHLLLKLDGCTVYPKKYAHGFCFAVLCCGYTLTDFPISIRLTSLALWQSSDCPSANKATLMNMDKYFMWIHYERLHNHNKAKHNKTVCIFLGIYCTPHCMQYTRDQTCYSWLVSCGLTDRVM